MTTPLIENMIAEVTRMESMVRDIQQQWNEVEQHQQTLLNITERLVIQNRFLFWLCVVQIAALAIFAIVRFA